MSVVPVQRFRDGVYLLALAPVGTPIAKMVMIKRPAMEIGSRSDYHDTRPAVGVIGRNNHAGAEADDHGNGQSEVGEFFHGVSTNKDSYFH